MKNHLDKSPPFSVVAHWGANRKGQEPVCKFMNRRTSSQDVNLREMGSVGIKVHDRAQGWRQQLEESSTEGQTSRHIRKIYIR